MDVSPRGPERGAAEGRGDLRGAVQNKAGEGYERKEEPDAEERGGRGASTGGVVRVEGA